ncbi:uncharacterized protein TNCV_5138391 [Trichonephila clavipes]|nr:uncharacterized protein TNCV_5138391 [Trichonephila clavipes]
MGNAVDRSDFDRGHIVMARRFETSISETARHVGCSRSTVVSTYAKWMNDGETNSRRHGVGRFHTLSKKKFVGDCLALRSKTGARQWLS